MSTYTYKVSWKVNDFASNKMPFRKKTTKRDNVVIKQLKGNSGYITMKIYQIIYVKKY